MNISLNTLSAMTPELTVQQLDQVDGGFLVIGSLIVLNMIIWGANGVVWAMSD